ncbi:hypothetical protein Q3G72_006039 [Acer saccharum]|nr:hypothetical protein Q3G72_006039 [Acer saccharum]
MVVERGLNFRDLAGMCFIEDVQRLGYSTYCTIHNQCNATMVQEFYTAMKHQEFLAGGSVKVRGKKVDIPAPRRAAEGILDWAVNLTTMVRDLSIEFRAFRDSFGSDETYTRRTPYHPRKRTRVEGPSSTTNRTVDPDGGSDADLEDPPIPPTYEPDPCTPFDAGAEFQSRLPYSPTTLILYPTPLWITKPSPSKD